MHEPRTIHFDQLLVAIGLALAVAALASGCGENMTPPSGPDAGVTFQCLPNLDGRIDADEMPAVVDRSVDYLVSGSGIEPAVDLAGSIEGQVRVWDFSTEVATDVRTPIAASSLAGKWYAADFAGGQLVLASERDSGIDAIYRKDDEALWLMGLASADESPAAGKTLLVYEAPVALFRFPIAPGDAYTEVGTITGGQLRGLPYNGTDTYETEVDGAGRVEVPYMAFTQSHRVRTRVVVAPAAGGVTTSRRQVSFLFECFGEVVRATSRADEPNRDFTTAAELRRLAL